MTAKNKYLQIYEYLRTKIETGDFDNNGRLESEAALCELFSTSRLTVRQATQMLEQEGLVERRKGSGTYVSNSSAASIMKSGNRTSRIGIIVPSVDELPFASFYENIERKLTQNNFIPILRATNNKMQTEREILKEFAELCIDGLIVSGTQSALPNANLDLYDNLKQSGVAIVFVSEPYKTLNFPFVKEDDTKAAQELVEHLIMQGHKKISCIFEFDSIMGHNRFVGYSQALAQHKLDLSDAFVNWYSSGKEQSVAADYEIGDSTACICHSHRIAELLIEHLEAKGIKIPENYSVVALDAPVSADSPITSALLPDEELCASVTRILFQALRGAVPGSKTTPMKVLIGKTSAPPKVHNPIIDGNWADPYILKDESGFYLYPTHRWNDYVFYAFHSENLLHWSAPQKVLDIRSLSWAKHSAWAPSVIKHNGLYYMVYVANQHLGFACSDSPFSEFKNISPTPFSPFEMDKTNSCTTPYDPHLIEDNGKLYMMFGIRQNWLVELQISKDSVKANSVPICLSERIFTEDGRMIPQHDKNAFNGCARIIKFQNRYLLTWSCYDTRDPRCQIRYAWSDNLEGPYVMPENSILLKGTNETVGTGHGCIIEHNNTLYLFYHRVVPNAELYGQEIYRELCFDTIKIINDNTLVVEPT